MQGTHMRTRFLIDTSVLVAVQTGTLRSVDKQRLGRLLELRDAVKRSLRALIPSSQKPFLPVGQGSNAISVGVAQYQLKYSNETELWCPTSCQGPELALSDRITLAFAVGPGDGGASFVCALLRAWLRSVAAAIGRKLRLRARQDAVRGFCETHRRWFLTHGDHPPRRIGLDLVKADQPGGSAA
jgi:hypothetical protein